MNNNLNRNKDVALETANIDKYQNFHCKLLIYNAALEDDDRRFSALYLGCKLKYVWAADFVIHYMTSSLSCSEMYLDPHLRTVKNKLAFRLFYD